MSAGPHWRRPHPLTAVVLIASFVAENAWPIVVLLIAGGGGIGFDMIALLVGGLTVVWGVLGWYMTGYALTDEAVEYRSGVLNRRARSIPLDRIQQVSVAEPVLARAVGLAVVQVAEASADGDVEIRYLDRSVANELTDRLRALARRREAHAGRPVSVGGPVSSLPPPARPSTRIHETRPPDLVRYQLATAAPVVALLTPVVIGIALVVGLQVGPMAGAVTVLFGVASLVVLALTVAVAALLQYGNFVLERGERSLTMETGLLSRRQVEVRPDRVQTLTVSSGPIARRLGLHEIRFSAATGKALKQQQAMPLAPVARTAAVSAIVQGSIDVDAGFGVALESVSPLTVRRMLIRSALVFVLIGLPVSVGLFVVNPAAPAVLILPWGAFSGWFARARHRRLGLSLDDQRLVVRRGVLQHHLTQLPLVSVQSVLTSASFFQRRLGLATLRVTTAGIGPENSVVIPDLVAARAEALRSRLGAAAAQTTWELRT